MLTSPYELTLIVLGLGTMLVSLRNPRGIAWVLLILADLIATTAYWKSGNVYGEVITGTTDFAVAYSIYALGKFKWEMWLCRLFLTSVLVSLVYLGLHGFGITFIDQDTYSSFLELINWAAFLLIGGTAAFQLFGSKDVLGDTYLLRHWRRRLSFLVVPPLRENEAYSRGRSV